MPSATVGKAVFFAMKGEGDMLKRTRMSQTDRCSMPNSANDRLEHYYARDRGEWRAWLERNHATAPGMWLVYYKQASGKPRVPYDEAVEEALCFGWIDSRANKLDNERYMQLFTPRKARSPWSKLNKERVERLIREGGMTAAGLRAINTAKENGAWRVYDMIEALSVPNDLQQALATDVTAREHFAAFSNSAKKQLLWYLESAKRPETRAKRTAQVVAAAVEGRNPLAYRATRREGVNDA